MVTLITYHTIWYHTIISVWEGINPCQPLLYSQCDQKNQQLHKGPWTVCWSTFGLPRRAIEIAWSPGLSHLSCSPGSQHIVSHKLGTSDWTVLWTQMWKVSKSEMQQPTCSAAGSSGSGTWRDMHCGLRFKTLADSAGSKVIHSTFELGMLFCGIEDRIQRKK